MSEKPEAHTPRFLAWLYSTPAQQPVLGALCGIEREIAASLRPGIDHHVAHTRLEWWRAECDRCAAGHPSHPLTRELLRSLEALAPGAGAGGALAGLTGLVDAAVWDLAGATFERREELAAYCRRWAAAMIEPLGAPGGSELGAALREIELLGDLAREAGAGRLRVPLDELERAGLAPAALAAPPWPPGLTLLLRARHQELRRQLAAAVTACSPQHQQSARGLIVWTALASQASARAERALPYPPAASIASAAAANWRAWRAARAAAAGDFRLR
ncbi:MAG: squalene/phytoene synthase family protein [Proteobacteria bacterium]|nr:squalene/phytoene synthase family protein [Pseudomonadota bacterium]